MPGTDEIYEAYLQRAIRDVNTLSDEIAACTLIDHPGRAMVLGSGHPLGDIMLVKYRPQPSELQEGVAFFGRAGQAVLKSVRRLGIDPLLIYGTNAVKCCDGDPDAAAAACPAWLAREFAIVEPKLVVAMGDEVVATLNELAIPLSQPIDPLRIGEIQRFTPTTDALVVPDVDASLNDEESKRRFWNAFRAVGAWYDALPPY